jgi:hypothetical protein
MSFLSYRFYDGMIHDSLVPRCLSGVAHQYNSTAAQLVA